MTDSTPSQARSETPPAVKSARHVTPAWIRQQLEAGRVLQHASAVHVELLPGNPERLDFTRRAQFAIFADQTPVCFATVGHDLSDLWHRTRGFAEACPALACRPLVYLQNSDWDLLAVEFFPGASLESRVRDGSLSPEEARKAIDEVLRSLECTRLPSDIAAGAREFDTFAERLLGSPLFSGFDQAFLREIVLPFVRHGALAGDLTTRWTNGDLIARNVLVDTSGNLRLVDCEFAGPTHFSAEDGLRWRKFSELPDELRELSLPSAPTPSNWLEIYFILRQFALESATNGAHLAVWDAQDGFERIIEILASEFAGFRSSAFLAAYGSHAVRATRQRVSGNLLAQLFWSADGAFTEAQSARRSFATDREARLRFLVPSAAGRLHLRLDPSDLGGLIRIAAIDIRRVEGGALQSLLGIGSPWNAFVFGPRVLRLMDTPELNLLALDDDPIIILPSLELGTGPTDLIVDVQLRHRTSLVELEDLLGKPAPRAASEPGQPADP